ncbi:DUF3363 domain-containing protein [Phenylobacterium sp.]|jgi:type IV secretory pathway VirD2 relaxase|uniref:DUF3363 domain-containing protein n=1 Tax=Phenylobacterium sp. TaxID=1871053 RepID=UPI002F9263FC
MTVQEDFRVRPGRIGARGARSRAFVAQVLQAAVKAGYVARRGGVGRRAAGRGRGAAIVAGLRSPARRVIVKSRIVRHAGRNWRAAPLGAHIAYLKRHGVDRSGADGGMFDARGAADEGAFAERCEGDRHHFRFIVSPEDAAQLQDLRGFARDLMRRAESDLGTRLDWIAVDHWNTSHPHLHILVRGVDGDGADLVIDGQYLSRGLRARAEGLVALELGPRTAREVAAGLERDAVAERWTRLDALLGAQARDGVVDLRPGPGAVEPSLRLLLIRRAETLERLGLASPEGVAVWRIRPDTQAVLRELAERGDIIASLHRAAGEGRRLEDLRPYADQAETPVLGRLVERGLHDELTGRAYVIVDGVDGRLHHLRLRDLEAAGDTPVGGIVESRTVEDGVRLLHRADLSVGDQVGASGATWLDRQLVAREPAHLGDRGFAAEVREALAARARRLVDEGLGSEGASGRFRFGPDLLSRLRTRELAAVAARLSRETGLPLLPESDDGRVRGRYVRRLDLASGRFAMLEDGLGFRLAPWARLLDRRLGQEVSGTLVRGGVDWDLGRRRGLGR